MKGTSRPELAAYCENQQRSATIQKVRVSDTRVCRDSRGLLIDDSRLEQAAACRTGLHCGTGTFGLQRAFFQGPTASLLEALGIFTRHTWIKKWIAEWLAENDQVLEWAIHDVHSHRHIVARPLRWSGDGRTRPAPVGRRYDKWFVQPIPPNNVLVGLPASAMTKAAWVELSDKPLEDYLKK